MDRYSRKDAERAFGRLCELLRKRTAGSYGDVGGWSLDYNGVYGGFVVQEVVNSGGGITHPLGHYRRPAREFCQMVSDITRALEVIRDSSPAA